MQLPVRTPLKNVGLLFMNFYLNMENLLWQYQKSEEEVYYVHSALLYFGYSF